MRSLYKIVHTTCQLQWGNLEKRIFNESVWMGKKGHKVIIVAPKDTPLFLKAKKRGFKVYGIEFKKLSMIKDYKLLKKIFYDEKPDILNTHGDKDSRLAFFAGKKTRVPLRILSMHIKAPVRNSWYNRRLYKKLCHYIFTNSDHTTTHLQKVFKINNMRIFSMPDGTIAPDPVLDKTETGMAVTQNRDLAEEHHTIDEMGRNIVRTYRLHQVKLDRQPF